MATSSSKTSSYQEVERKFEAVDSTVAPSFDGLSVVGRVERSPSSRMEAVYFDTFGHALADRGITLRRRTGGADAGWHLKLPAGPDARRELRVPLSAVDEPGEVPAELREAVLAIVRDRPLVPVARIDTHRTVDLLYGPDGALLAEFCDDQVTATAGNGAADAVRQQWREWELELAAGVTDRKVLNRLANRLLDAGASPAAHGSKLARVLDGADAAQPDGAAGQTDPIHRAVAEQVEQLLVWDRAVRVDADDSVHQMRVTTRKLRSLLQSSAASFGLTGQAWVLDELRQLAGVLGVARDAEVLAERYQRGLAALPDELVRGPVREQLVGGALRRYRSGHRRVLAALRSERYFRLLDALEDLAQAPPVHDETDTEPAGTTLAAAYKRVRKAAKAAAKAAEDADRDEALHRIRKGAKRLRYTAAATGATKVAKRAKAVQTLLGDHQDSVVSRTHLIQQADAAHSCGADTFTYGLLYQQEVELAQRCRDQLDDALRKLHKAMRKTSK
ncbi:CYTH and CHAD domain-containing protein [Mycolicibacterium thermoresistibile]